MNSIKIRKVFELRSRDQRELSRRIDALGEAIRARRGKILDIRWNGGTAGRAHHASVLYQVPLAEADIETLAMW